MIITRIKTHTLQILAYLRIYRLVLFIYYVIVYNGLQEVREEREQRLAKKREEQRKRRQEEAGKIYTRFYLSVSSSRWLFTEMHFDIHSPMQLHD